MIQINLPELHELEKIRPEELPDSLGVYFIFDKSNNLLYIGKSKNMKQRVHTHMLECGSSPIKDKSIIGLVAFVPVHEYCVNTEGIEKIYIDLYNPPYNNIKEPNIIDMITPELQRSMTAHVPMR